MLSIVLMSSEQVPPSALIQAEICRVTCAELADAPRIIRPSVQLSRDFIWLLHTLNNILLYKIKRKIFDRSRKSQARQARIH